MIMLVHSNRYEPILLPSWAPWQLAWRPVPEMRAGVGADPSLRVKKMVERGSHLGDVAGGKQFILYRPPFQGPRLLLDPEGCDAGPRQGF